MTLDRKLQWNDHIKNITKRAKITMGQCRKMMGKNWGLSPKISKWTYTALIRPILGYGNIVWLPGLETTKNVNELKKVQRKGCLSTLRPLNSTPTDGMELILGLPPIDLHIKMNALNSYLRMNLQKTWRTVPGQITKKIAHSNLIKKIKNEIKDIQQTTDKLQHRDYIEKKFTVKIEDRETIQTKNIRPRPENNETIHCFTDGSKNDNSTGWGFITMSFNNKYQSYKNIGKNASVFQAEIHALAAAAEKMNEMDYTNKQIEIYVGSQAALLALEKYIITDKSVQTCKQNLNRLATGNNVTLNWIPGHCGHLGNEVADRLAKRGADLPAEQAEEVPVPQTHIKSLIKNWATKRHQTRWTWDPDECKQTKMFLPKVENRIWKKIENQSIQRIRLVTQIITGHATLRKHLFRMKIVDSPLCPKCGEENETVEHLFCSCPAFMYERVKNLGKFFLKREDLKLLKLNQIINFAESTKRFEYEN